MGRFGQLGIFRPARASVTPATIKKPAIAATPIN